jgi:hypothetical protein
VPGKDEDGLLRIRRDAELPDDVVHLDRAARGRRREVVALDDGAVPCQYLTNEIARLLVARRPGRALAKSRNLRGVLERLRGVERLVQRRRGRRRGRGWRNGSRRRRRAGWRSARGNDNENGAEEQGSQK